MSGIAPKKPSLRLLTVAFLAAFPLAGAAGAQTPTRPPPYTGPIVIPELVTNLQPLIDAKAPVTISGVVTKFERVNPAPIIHVRDKAGQDWLVKTELMNRILKAGGSKDSFPDGLAITATGLRALDKSCTPACTMFAPLSGLSSNGATILPNAQPQ